VPLWVGYLEGVPQSRYGKWDRRTVRTMMLVYSLPATEAIYQRFAGISGSAYFVGGLGMTALRTILSWYQFDLVLGYA
jgi:hypothetical protein